jgi:hypothetical protein
MREVFCTAKGARVYSRYSDIEAILYCSTHRLMRYHFLGAEKAKRMLIEFDQTTMAKMTAALDTAPRDAQAYRGRNCRVRDPVSAR